MKLIKGESHYIKHKNKQPHIMREFELRVGEANSPVTLQAETMVLK
jgi:hypothetical protein